MAHKRTQRENDCGVCAVATALRVSWSEAARFIFGPAWANKLRFNTKTRQIAAVLFPHGGGGLVRASSWAEIPNNAICKVILPWQEGTGGWHWVVYRNRHVLCSNKARRIPPERYEGRLVSYIAQVSFASYIRETP